MHDSKGTPAWIVGTGQTRLADSDHACTSTAAVDCMHRSPAGRGRRISITFQSIRSTVDLVFR